MKNFLIVEDHPSVRMSVKIMLNDIVPGAKIDEVPTFYDALSYLKTNSCNMIILDLNVPGGDHLGMIEKIRQLQEKVSILIYSGYEEALYALPYVAAGANGFVSKTSTEKEFRDAIISLIGNRQYVSTAIQQLLLNVMKKDNRDGYNPLRLLTDRETDIMTLVLQGLSSKEICSVTNLKMSTISTFKLNIFKKVGVTNTIDLYKKVELLKSEHHNSMQ